MTNPLSLSIKANGFYFKKDLSYHLKPVKWNSPKLRLILI